MLIADTVTPPAGLGRRTAELMTQLCLYCGSLPAWQHLALLDTLQNALQCDLEAQRLVDQYSEFALVRKALGVAYRGKEREDFFPHDRKLRALAWAAQCRREFEE
jgi:hypothetical protein